MFSSISLFKSNPSPSPYVFSFIQSEFDESKIKMESKMQMFQELRDDFQHVLINDSLDLFVNGGSIDVIDNQLQHALLPQFKNKYLNILGCIKFLRLKKSMKGLEKVSVELFEQMLQVDGNVADNLVHVLGSNNFSSELKNSEDLVGITMAGKKNSRKINEGILTEGGDMKLQITMINENKDVIDRIDALFYMALTIASLDGKNPASSLLPSRFEMIARKELGKEEELSEEDDYFLNYPRSSSRLLPSRFETISRQELSKIGREEKLSEEDEYMLGL